MPQAIGPTVHHHGSHDALFIASDAFLIRAPAVAAVSLSRASWPDASQVRDGLPGCPGRLKLGEHIDG